MNRNCSPLVSIIVPIYNVENFLEKCIKSIIEQDYKNLEIILVDDGSPDNCPKICDNFSKIDNRIKVIHKKNAGVSMARNSGLEFANGEYVCFVDGDDYIMKDYVSYLINLISSNKTDIALTTDMFGNFDEKQTKKIESYVVSGEKATELILSYRIPIGCYCKIFKNDFLKKNKIKFFSDLFIGEGFNFNVLAFQHSKEVAIGNRKIYYYRRDNPTSAMTKFSIKKCENELYAIEKMKKCFILKSEIINNAWKYAKWRTHSDVYDLIILSKTEKRHVDIYKECMDIMKKGFFYSLKCSTSKKDKLRAFIMMIFPKIIPFAMILRKKKFNIKV